MILRRSEYPRPAAAGPVYPLAGMAELRLAGMPMEGSGSDAGGLAGEGNTMHSEPGQTNLKKGGDMHSVFELLVVWVAERYRSRS